jgi:hypothetical protein
MLANIQPSWVIDNSQMVFTPIEPLPLSVPYLKDLTVKGGTVFTSCITEPSHFVFGPIRLDLKTGEIEIPSGMELSEASRAIWEGVSAVCGGHLHHRRLTQELERELQRAKDRISELELEFLEDDPQD